MAVVTMGDIDPRPSAADEARWARDGINGRTLPKVTPGIYRHYKGNIYRVLFITDYTGEWKDRGEPTHAPQGFPEGEKLVVYIGCYDNPHGNRECSRPVREWLEHLNEVQFVNDRGGDVVYTGVRYLRIGD